MLFLIYLQDAVDEYNKLKDLKKVCGIVKS